MSIDDYYTLINDLNQKESKATSEKEKCEAYKIVVDNFNKTINKECVINFSNAMDAFEYGYIKDDGIPAGQKELADIISRNLNISSKLGGLINEIDADISKYNSTINDCEVQIQDAYNQIAYLQSLNNK